MNNSNNQWLGWVLLLIAAAAWVQFAEHPTARNLRRAVIDTLEV